MAEKSKCPTCGKVKSLSAKAFLLWYNMKKDCGNSFPLEVCRAVGKPQFFIDIDLAKAKLPKEGTATVCLSMKD